MQRLVIAEFYNDKITREVITGVKEPDVGIIDLLNTINNKIYGSL